ncbi:MAG: DUF1456 family protein [Saprospiraceae bacterium]
MDNNDVLRRLRFTFDFSDSKMMQLFKQGGLEVSRAEISAWLKKEGDPEGKQLYDVQMATFLNGLIIEHRGKKEGEIPKAEKRLNNNLVFRKLKIAFSLKDEDILDLYDLAGVRISKHEISAFFRKPTQSQYRLCKDQFLRSFLQGLQMKHRPVTAADEPEQGKSLENRMNLIRTEASSKRRFNKKDL